MSVCRHGPFGHHPGWMGDWRQFAPVMLRFLLLEWNAKSGCAVDPVILASEGDAYIPGRVRPLHTRFLRAAPADNSLMVFAPGNMGPHW